MFKDKRVLLGVTGGVAAYKAIEIASRLKKMGAYVDVCLTENALHFVTPLAFFKHNWQRRICGWF